MPNSDPFEAIRFQRIILTASGAWPQPNQTKFYIFRHVCNWLVNICFITVLLLQQYKNIIDSDYDQFIDSITFLAIPLSYVVKHLTIIINGKKFLKVLELLEDPVLKQHPNHVDKHMQKAIKQVKILMITYQVTISIGIVILYGMKPLVTNESTAFRFTVFDLGEWAILMHLFQVLGLVVLGWNNTTLDTLALGLIAIGVGQFGVIKEKIIHARQWAEFNYEDIFDGDDDDFEEYQEDGIDDKVVSKRINECAYQHVIITEFADGLEDIFTYYFLAQFAASLISILNTWFQLKATVTPMGVVFLINYVTGILIELGIYCFYGDSLMSQSEEIRDACYMSQWYKCNPKIRKSLILIMERSKRATVFTAGKFATLSLQSYASILQASYSFFTLMNRMYGE